MKADPMSSSPKLLIARANTSGMLPAFILAAALSGCSFGSPDTGTGGASIDVAEAALNGGSPRVALQVAQTILERSPDNVDALLVRGDALTQLEQNDNAVAAFQRALSKDPTSAHGKLGLARIRLTTDPTEAAGLLRDVLRTAPSNVSALTDLGIALDLLGQHAEAQTFYHRVLHDNPNNMPVQVNLALSLAMSGDSAAALRLIEPLARDQSAPMKIRHNYAAILTMAGRRAEAAAILKPDLSPEDTTRALAAYKQGTTAVAAAPARVVPAQTAPAPTQAAITAAAPLPVVAAAQTAKLPPAARTETFVATQTSAPLGGVPAAAAPPPVVAAAQTAKLPPAARTETFVATQTSAPLGGVPAAAAPPMVTATPALEAPAPVTPVPTAAANPTPPSAEPAAPLLANTEIGPHVQLGAFMSERAARDEWVRLQRTMPEALARREPAFTTVVHNGTTYWRLRTWGFPDQATAKGFCSQLRPATLRCLAYRA